MNATQVNHYVTVARARGLDRKAIAVYRVLLTAARRGTDGLLDTGPISNTHLAQEAGYSESSVRRARRDLIDAGLVSQTVAGSGWSESEYFIVEGVT